jgi:ketosteroid isomerase-like protein
VSSKDIQKITVTTESSAYHESVDHQRDDDALTSGVENRRPAPSAEPQRLVIARRFLLSFSEGQITDASDLLSPLVTYVVPGRHKMSGTFHGREEVTRHIAALHELSGGTGETLKWIDWMVGETHIAALQYGQAQRGGSIYRGHHLYLLKSDESDLVLDIRIFFEDQEAADRFFNA